MSSPLRSRKTKRAQSHPLHAVVSRRREEQALEALVALALRHDQDGISDAEISKYMSQPTRLSKADQAALDRARPKLLKALRKELRPDTKRYMAAWGKPANEKLSHTAPTTT